MFFLPNNSMKNLHLQHIKLLKYKVTHGFTWWIYGSILLNKSYPYNKEIGSGQPIE